jgi:hypothetical protein
MPERLRFNKTILDYSCVEPDYSRKYIKSYINGHFADIDNLSTEPPDAYALAKLYTQKMLKENKNKNYEKRDMYLGYALHFIEDMLNPVHVVFKKAPKFSPIRVSHKKFEGVATTVEKNVVKNTKLEKYNYKEDFFSQTLPKAMRYTKVLSKKVSVNNSSNYLNISERALKNTYITVNKYLHYIVKQIKPSFEF